jgi:mono/diheme cytochrome c family protein
MKAVVLLLALRAAAQGVNDDMNDAAERGGVIFSKNCASCHGPAAKGLSARTDLIGSALVRDDEKGEQIGPLLRGGHAGARLSDAQIADVVAWLHVQVYNAANRNTYQFLNILSGDPKQGERFFNGPGKCNTCHSVTGDLAHIGEKYDPPVLQTLWLSPIRRKTKNYRTNPTVTVTPATGAPVQGTLEHLDEFNVALRDSSGVYRSFAIDNDVPRVEIHDPLAAHYDLYHRLTDADIHNITAYLAAIK